KAGKVPAVRPSQSGPNESGPDQRGLQNPAISEFFAVHTCSSSNLEQLSPCEIRVKRSRNKFGISLASTAALSSRMRGLDPVESGLNRRLPLRPSAGHPPQRRKGSSSRGCCAENLFYNFGKVILFL